MSVEEVRPKIEAWRHRGQRYAVAVLAAAWRSAPRKPGARFVRSEEGEIGGNVSAGCVEADLAERLAGVLAGDPPGLVTYGVSDETAHGVGLACGGRIDVYLEAREPDDTIWPALLGRLDERAPVILLTEIPGDGGTSGRHWLLDPEGDVLAADGPDVPPPPAVAAARGLMATGGVRMIGGTDETDEGGGPHAETGGPAVLVEVFLPPRHLIVVGATPVGAALARLAEAAGIPVEVIEPRAGYAAAARDDGVIVDEAWPDEALAARNLDMSTAVAVVAHDGRLDAAALEAALASPAGYVGLLGGRRTRERRFAALRDGGVAESDLERIRAPIGLDIGAERPGEIALAILAEIIAAWRGAE